jgi:hypothetical protein
MEVSCDTVFYKLAYELWLRDGGIAPRRPLDAMTRMAKAFGLGKPTGDRPARGVRRTDRRPALEAALLGADEGVLLRQGAHRLPGGGCLANPSGQRS